MIYWIKKVIFGDILVILTNLGLFWVDKLGNCYKLKIYFLFNYKYGSYLV